MQNNVACEIYYRYHFDSQVKFKGDEAEEFKIPKCYQTAYIRLIEQIQQKMIDIVAYKRIGIETNLTSNLKIGNIGRYVSHPILKFYNVGLHENVERAYPSTPQIIVSINTDDQGIFATSLEKEFTLMTLALEKQTDASGNPLYEHDSVYNWIDNVRENAFIQKFMNKI